MTTGATMMNERYATAGSFRVRYFDNELAPAQLVVVLLHDGAWGGSSDMTWGRTFEHLPADVRVISPDLLGFGGSDKAVFLDRSPYAFRARVVGDLLTAIGIQTPVHLVGNSFGGSAALRALEDPDWVPRLASVTTISGTGGPWRTPLALRELATFDGSVGDMDRLMRLVTEPFDGWTDYLRSRVEWAGSPGHFQSMVAPHQQPPEPLRRSRPADLFPESLRESGVPVHVIAGARDPLVEPGWTDIIEPALPAGSTVTTLDAGHSPNLDDPAGTWRVVEDFIRRNA
jgi:pimeloyl-ACP methyl ester carboxylesterase